MANIDVSDLMTDIDFVDKIQVITRTPWVDHFGTNYIGEIILDSVGSVQPANFRTVQKLPEAMRVANLYSFWFKGRIVASAPGLYSSILVFNKVRYQIQTVSDWSNFGAGYSEGTCVQETPT